MKLSSLKIYAPFIAIVLIFAAYFVARNLRNAEPAASAPPTTVQPPATQAPLPPSGPMEVRVATQWNTYHGGTDLSGYTEHDFTRQPNVTWQVLLEGRIAQPPVANDTTLFAATPGGLLVAFDFTGKELWRRQLLRADNTSPERLDAPIAAFRDAVFAPCTTGRIHALDAATGEPRWVYDVTGEILSTINLHAPEDASQPPSLYIVQRTDGILHAIDFDTGQQLSVSDPLGRCDGSLAVAEGLAVYGNCNFVLNVHGAQDGVLQKNIRLCDDCQVASGPAVIGEYAYTGTRVGYFYCLNVATGGIVWTNQDCTGEIFSTAAIGPSTVVFGSEDDNVFALDRTTGRLLWEYEADGQPTSPVIAGSTVIVGVDGVIQALELATGNPLWSHEVSDGITSPSIIGGMIVVGSEDGTLLALAPGTASDAQAAN